MVRVARTVLSLVVAVAPFTRSAIASSSTSDVEKLAGQLGDADPRVRAAAMKSLREAGASADEALRGMASSSSSDPETAGRANAILRSAQLPKIDEPPFPEPPELTAYRQADRESKAQIVAQLVAAGGNRAGSLVRAWATEENAELRTALFQGMHDALPLSASALIAHGHAPTARQLLESALAKGNVAAVAPFVALSLLHDETDDAIARWSSRTLTSEDAEPTPAAELATPLLAWLHRARGDSSSPAAIDWARSAGQFDLLTHALRDARDWQSLADVVASQPNPENDAGIFNLLCGARVLAGDGAGLTADIERMLKALGPNAADDVTRVLLLGGRVDEALRLLADAKRWGDQFKVLAAQERWDEAFALLASQDAARDPAAILFRITAAEHCYGLGDRARATDLLARCAKENEPLRSAEIDVAIGDAYRRIGETDKAWTHFRAAMKPLDQRKEDVGMIAWRAFYSDPDGDNEADVGGSNLWALIQLKHGGETFEQRFDRARAFVDGTMSIDDLQRLASVRGNRSSIGGLVYSTNLLRTVGQRMRDAGRTADAEQYLANAAERAPSAEYAVLTLVRLGDWAAEAKDWAKAADWYGRAWNADRSRPAPLYLRAWAIREAGYPARAAELMDLARAIPLADPWRRMESVRFLNQHRVSDALSREVTLILGTSRPDIYPADLAQRHRAEESQRAGEWLVAAACHERLLLNFASIYARAEPNFFLRMPHSIHRLRAKGLLARGEVDAAEREIALCRATLPADVMLAIDVVPEFDRLGDKARADELYAEAMRAKDAVLAKYPDAANHHNDAAWLAINCGRDAEKAMTHAKRAVELRLTNAAYIDTLAEVQFRRGNFDEAIKTMARCVELEPRAPRHREQLERFEAGKRGEVRAMPPG